jgi:hypothetical protein
LAFDARGALQLQIIEPSSPLSQLRADLQLPDLSNASHSSEPTQEHRQPLSGVSKHLKVASAGCARVNASINVSVRRAVRVLTLLASPLTPAKRRNHGAGASAPWLEGPHWSPCDVWPKRRLAEKTATLIASCRHQANLL